MMHKAWSSIEEVPYCFTRSYVKFQGHTALKFVEFDPNWGFPDCNSSLNSPMAMKCCTKLETAKERCPIVFQGHPSNFKVTRYKTSPTLTQIGRFRTIGQSQLSNPSDLSCLGSSIKFQGHTGWKIDDLNPIWERLLGRSQLSNPSDLPQIVDFSACVTLKFDKLFAAFRSHWWIQTGVTVRKHLIGVKIDDFFSRVTLKFDGWPSKTIGHLFYATSSFVQHFIAIGEFKLELQPAKD